MKILLISNDENIINLLKNNNIIKSTDYDEIIKLLKEQYDIIIIDSFTEINILKLLNNYSHKEDLEKTIIIDNIRLHSYNLSNCRYQVYTIINTININNDLLYYIEEINKNNATYNKDKSDLYKEIATILKRLGISPDKTGFHYLRKAIYECYINPSLLNEMNNKLYPILEDTFNISKSDIERSMRYSIEIGYRKSEYDFTDNLFSNILYIEQTKPRCSEFIAIVVEELMNIYNKTIY